MPKAKRPKRVGTIAGPRNVEKEITYAELFETVDPVHCYIAEEKVSEAEGMGLSPSWNPLMNAVGPTLLQEVQDDPLAYVWEEMRAAQESCKKVCKLMCKLPEIIVPFELRVVLVLQCSYDCFIQL